MSRPILTITVGVKTYTTNDEFMKCFVGLNLAQFCEVVQCLGKNTFMTSQIRFLDITRLSQILKLEIQVNDTEIIIEPFEIRDGEVQCLF